MIFIISHLGCLPLVFISHFLVGCELLEFKYVESSYNALHIAVPHQKKKYLLNPFMNNLQAKSTPKDTLSFRHTTLSLDFQLTTQTLSFTFINSLYSLPFVCQLIGGLTEGDENLLN